MIKHLAILAVLWSCGKSKPVDPDPKPSSEFEKQEIVLVSNFLVEGFVISKTSGGGEEDQGDSLLFTGLALGVLDCNKISPILEGLERMQKNWTDHLVRIDPMPQEYVMKTDMISRDGATGALFGLTKASKRCPNASPRISRILSKWKSAINGKLMLYPGSLAGIITPSFHTFMKLAYGTGVSDVEYEEMMVSALVSAVLITKNKSACYPLHLQTIQNLVMEQMGHPILKRHKDEWCALVSEKGLLLTDWYCQKNHQKVEEWLAHPENSSHVYMHQRCAWESTDSDDKLSPRIDFLILDRLYNEGSIIK